MRTKDEHLLTRYPFSLLYDFWSPLAKKEFIMTGPMALFNLYPSRCFLSNFGLFWGDLFSSLLVCSLLSFFQSIYRRMPLQPARIRLLRKGCLTIEVGKTLGLSLAITSSSDEISYHGSDYSFFLK